VRILTVVDKGLFDLKIIFPEFFQNLHHFPPISNCQFADYAANNILAAELTGAIDFPAEGRKTELHTG